LGRAVAALPSVLAQAIASTVTSAREILRPPLSRHERAMAATVAVREE